MKINNRPHYIVFSDINGVTSLERLTSVGSMSPNSTCLEEEELFLGNESVSHT